VLLLLGGHGANTAPRSSQFASPLQLRIGLPRCLDHALLTENAGICDAFDPPYEADIRALARRRGMFETSRVLGEQQEAELIREAERLAGATGVERSRSHMHGPRALARALRHLRAGRPSKRVRRRLV
jgi:hypothetical protein